MEDYKNGEGLKKKDEDLKKRHSLTNKQGIAETAKTNGPTCDNTCIQKI